MMSPIIWRDMYTSSNENITPLSMLKALKHTGGDRKLLHGQKLVQMCWSGVPPKVNAPEIQLATRSIM